MQLSSIFFFSCLVFIKGKFVTVKAKNVFWDEENVEMIRYMFVSYLHI